MLLRGLFPVVGEQDGLVVDMGIQMDGALPDLLEMLERLDGVLHLDIRARVTVGQIQLPAVPVIAVHHIDVRLPVIGQHEQELFLDLVEVAVDHDHAAGARIVAVVVELLILGELRREELVEEGHVVVQRADLEDLLPPRGPLSDDGPLGLLVLAPFTAGGHVVTGFVLRSVAAGVPSLLDVAQQLHADLVGVQSSG